MDTLDVDDPLLAVDLGDLALATLVGSTNDEDLIVLADGDRPGLHTNTQMSAPSSSAPSQAVQRD